MGIVSPREGEPSIIWGVFVSNVTGGKGGRCTDFESDEGFAFVVLVWCCSCGFSSDDAEFHVLDLQPHQQEVDSADDDVFQVILALAVLKLNVQTVLDPYVHLDTGIDLRRDTV
jgi:hypothetical protein